jgi:flagella basal body P-ring formation protein FlgA
MAATHTQTAVIRRPFVGLLTIGRQIRRFSDALGGRLLPLLCCSALFFTSATQSPTHAQAVAVAWQSIDEISRVAEEFLRERVGTSDQRVSPQAGRLDARLQLPQCSEDLEPFLRRGTEVRSRTIVGVRCNGQRPWKMYVPVDVVVTESVLITSRALPKGHVLAAADFAEAERDISRLSGGYIVEPARLIGQRLKQPLRGGRIITPSVLQADVLVRRGQTVTLIVRNDALNIRMTGTALMDGVENQRIRVENGTSQRIVEGLVRSRELVEILIN